jgi:pimeloyl-ACP methyl ester carboxylesterase
MKSRGKIMKIDIITTDTIALEHYIPDRIEKEQKVLFIHSSGHGSWMWKNFLPYFSERGYDSWALNLRGHHLAPKVENWGSVGAQEYLEDIKEAVNITGENIVLIGHSMSGVLILKHAESNKVSGLIVSQSGPPKPILDRRGISLTGPVPNKKPSTGNFIPPLRDRARVEAMLFDKGNVDKESINLVLEMSCEESARVGKEIMGMDIDSEKITAPVFVLGYDTSKIGVQAGADLNKILVEEFKAKDFKVIEPGGHDYMLEKNWADFAAQLESWTSSI